MGKKIILFLLAFLIAFFLSEIVLMQRTYSVVNGAKSLRLINGCEMVFIDKPASTCLYRGAGLPWKGQYQVVAAAGG